MKLTLALFFFFLIACAQANANSCIGFYTSNGNYHNSVFYSALLKSAEKSDFPIDAQSMVEFSNMSQMLLKQLKNGNLNEFKLEQMVLDLLAKSRKHIPWTSRLGNYFKATTEDSVLRSNLQTAVFSTSQKQLLSEVYNIRELSATEQTRLFIKKAHLVRTTVEASVLVAYLNFFGLSSFLVGAPLPTLKLSAFDLEMKASTDKAIESDFATAFEELKRSQTSSLPLAEGKLSTFRRRYYIATLLAMVALMPKDMATYQVLGDMVNPFAESTIEYRKRTGLDQAAEKKLKDWEDSIVVIDGRKPTEAEKKQELDRIRGALASLYKN